jgi:ubiquitin carboxyl-terminal hydrolase L3
MTSPQATHAPGVTFDASGKKFVVPLENNPEVFTHLIHSLGVSPELGFYDIYSLDPELTSFIPRPVHSIIFIAPSGVYYKLHGASPNFAVQDLNYAGSGDDEPVIWFSQTIGHSCGLMALIHCVANGTARQFVQPGSLLDKLLHEAIPHKPVARADVLYNSSELEHAHMAAAQKGDSRAPQSNEPNGYHFLAFVKGSDGHLYEMNGSWDGPLDHGKLPEGDDLMSEKALEMGVGRYMKLADGGIEYSMVALATNPEA